MRASPLLFLGGLLLAQGCYVGPVFRVKQKKQTCSEPFLVWGGGLVSYVDAGRGDGSFSYAPTDPLYQWVEGNYDLKTGDFWWQADYVPDSYRIWDQVEGYGTIWRDGDSDIFYSVNAVTDEEDTFEFDVREQRLGCDMERWVYLTDGIDTEDEDEVIPTEVWAGTFTGGVYEYEHRFSLYGEVMEATGTSNPDGSHTEELRWEDGDATIRWDEEGDGEGGVRREFYEDVGSVLDGYWERAKNGDLVVEYYFEPVASPGQAWDYEVDERGNGRGALEIGENKCDIDLDEWECTLEDCTTAALEGEPCSPPVRIPLVEYRR